MKIDAKRVLCIVLTITLFSSIMGSNIIIADLQIVMTINDVTLSVGKNDSTFLNVSGVSDVVGSCSVTLSWDPDVVTVVHVIDGDFYRLYPYVDSVNGSLSLIAISMAGLSGDFCIAEIVLEAVGNDGDFCDLVIEQSELLNVDDPPTEISHSVINGKIAIETEDNNDGSNGGGSGGNGGMLPEIDYVISNASLSDTMGFVGEPLLFDGSKSTAYESITSYDWDFADGTTGTGITTFHSYSNAGVYKVMLNVTDKLGATDTDTINVTIFQSANYPPSKPVLVGPNTGQKNNTYEFTILSTDEDNDTIKYHIDWGDGNKFNTTFIPQNTSVTINHSWTKSGRYLITITADDDNTLSETSTYVFLIDTMEIFYEETYLGFITDENNDGTFDTFEHKPEYLTYLEDKELYLIDYDADGSWDYTYDVETKVVARFTDNAEDYKKTNDMNGDNSILIYGLLFITILCVILFIIFRKHKKL